ncbi:MAG: hypothetical protein A2543_02825 [Candidatus Komeilibacteria bacterium RIFOXYD2_FULL_37_8]|nr:MAG: hypothetical protein A2543_02825 [Candidatus Komeilibacteria bacterium RIFOXYD2_FULL_37_8]
MRLLDKFSHLRFFSLWLIFLLISLLFFGQSLNNFFASDDFHWLVIARDTQWSWQIFFTNYEGGHVGGSYNPLLVIIFKLFDQLFSTNYFVYHLASLLFHSINGLLVYILANKIFDLTGIKNKGYSLVAALLFLLYPIHVEAIAWIAAWPHLLVTIFYLLALINYFVFKDSGRKITLLYSFIFFILALLIKEIAISLPFLILIWEVYFYSLKNNKRLPFYYLAFYFVIWLLFLALRYLFIGLIFGYYGASSLKFSLVNLVSNILPFFGDFLTWGFLRNVLYRGLYQYADLVAIVIMAGLAGYFFILLTKKKYQQFVGLGSLFLMLAPVLIVGLHRTTFAGERYLYLPSVFFIIWILFLLQQINWSFKAVSSALVVFILLSFSVVYYKIDIWNQASDLSQQIVVSYSDLEIKSRQSLISIALPDNLSGAEVFRNNLQQALEIYYPNNYPMISSTQAYLEVNRDNKNNQLLKWRQDTLGWFGESVDGSFVVTGITSIASGGLYWELWNYNYQNYQANLIRLMPESDLKVELESGQTKILIFDRGVLKILP